MVISLFYEKAKNLTPPNLNPWSDWNNI